MVPLWGNLASSAPRGPIAAATEPRLRVDVVVEEHTLPGLVRALRGWIGSSDGE